MRFVVTGCGSIGRRHATNLVALGHEVVVHDVRAEARQALAKDLGASAFSDLTTALASRPDALLVCTPTRFHLEAATAAADQGVHLFIEKPISHDRDGLESFLAAAERRGLVTLVGCNFRFDAGLQQVKQAIDAGRIGRPLHLHATFGQYLPDWHPKEDYRKGYSAQQAMGGGIILDAIHELDYARWLLGEPIEVSCFADHIGDLEIDVEDSADLVVRFRSGARASIHLDYLSRSYHRACDVTGTTGNLRWNFENDTVDAFTASDKKWESVRAGGKPDVNRMYVEEMRHFIRCLEGVERPTQGARDAASVLDVALAAKESSRTGSRVRLGVPR